MQDFAQQSREQKTNREEQRVLLGKMKARLEKLEAQEAEKAPEMKKLRKEVDQVKENMEECGQLVNAELHTNEREPMSETTWERVTFLAAKTTELEAEVARLKRLLGPKEAKVEQGLQLSPPPKDSLAMAVDDEELGGGMSVDAEPPK